MEWDESNEVVGDIVDLDRSAAAGVMLKGDGFRIELFEYSVPESTVDPASAKSCDLGIRHLALHFDDIDETCQRLLDGGGTMHHASCARRVRFNEKGLLPRSLAISSS